MNNFYRLVAPELTARGFTLRRSAFVSTTDTMHMEIFPGPDARIDRIESIALWCSSPADPDVTLYHFSQIRAALGRTRERYTDARQPDWPQVVTRHFREFTIPFIDTHPTFDTIVEDMLALRIPPDPFTPDKVGAIMEAYRITCAGVTSFKTEEVLAAAASLGLDWWEHRMIAAWAERNGVALSIPKPGLTGGQLIEPLLPRRWKRANRL